MVPILIEKIVYHLQYTYADSMSLEMLLLLSLHCVEFQVQLGHLVNFMLED